MAFLAKISTFTGSSSSDTIIPFDVVDLNIGNGYDPVTGIFTPSVSGIYVISYEGMADSSCGTGNIGLTLQINGASVSKSNSEFAGSGGISLTVQLSAGDIVTIVVDNSDACVVLFSSSTFNKFSGHLLYQII